MDNGQPYVHLRAINYLNGPGKDTAWMNGIWQIESHFSDVDKKTMENLENALNSRAEEFGNRLQEQQINYFKTFAPSIAENIIKEIQSQVQEAIQEVAVNEVPKKVSHYKADANRTTTSGKRVRDVITSLNKSFELLKKVGAEQKNEEVKALMLNIKAAVDELQILSNTIEKAKADGEENAEIVKVIREYAKQKSAKIKKELGLTKKGNETSDFISYMDKAVDFANSIIALLGIPSSEEIGKVAEMFVVEVFNDEKDHIIEEKILELHKDISAEQTGTKLAKGNLIGRGESAGIIVSWLEKHGSTIDELRGKNWSKHSIIKIQGENHLYQMRGSPQLADVTITYTPSESEIKTVKGISVKAYSKSTVKLTTETPLAGLLLYQTNATYHFLNVWATHEDDDKLSELRKEWKTSIIPWFLTLKGLSGERVGTTDSISTDMFVYRDNNSGSWVVTSTKAIATALEDENNRSALTFNMPNYFNNMYVDAGSVEEAKEIRTAMLYNEAYQAKITSHLNLKALGLESFNSL